MDEAVMNRKPFGQLVHDAPSTGNEQALTVATAKKEAMSTGNNAHMHDILGSDFARPVSDEEPRFPPSVKQAKEKDTKKQVEKEEEAPDGG